MDQITLTKSDRWHMVCASEQGKLSQIGEMLEFLHDALGEQTVCQALRDVGMLEGTDATEVDNDVLAAQNRLNDVAREIADLKVPQEQTFAEVSWNLEDAREVLKRLKELESYADVELTDEQLLEFMDGAEDQVANDMIERGWDALDTLLQMFVDDLRQ